MSRPGGVGQKQRGPACYSPSVMFLRGDMATLEWPSSVVGLKHRSLSQATGFKSQPPPAAHLASERSALRLSLDLCNMGVK